MNNLSSTSSPAAFILASQTLSEMRTYLAPAKSSSPTPQIPIKSESPASPKNTAANEKENITNLFSRLILFYSSKLEIVKKKESAQKKIERIRADITELQESLIKIGLECEKAEKDIESIDKFSDEILSKIMELEKKDLEQTVNKLLNSDAMTDDIASELSNLKAQRKALAEKIPSTRRTLLLLRKDEAGLIRQKTNAEKELKELNAELAAIEQECTEKDRQEIENKIKVLSHALMILENPFTQSSQLNLQQPFQGQPRVVQIQNEELSFLNSVFEKCIGTYKKAEELIHKKNEKDKQVADVDRIMQETAAKLNTLTITFQALEKTFRSLGEQRSALSAKMMETEHQTKQAFRQRVSNLATSNPDAMTDIDEDISMSTDDTPLKALESEKEKVETLFEKARNDLFQMHAKIKETAQQKNAAEQALNALKEEASKIDRELQSKYPGSVAVHLESRKTVLLQAKQIFEKHLIVRQNQSPQQQVGSSNQHKRGKDNDSSQSSAKKPRGDSSSNSSSSSSSSSQSSASTDLPMNRPLPFGIGVNSAAVHFKNVLSRSPSQSKGLLHDIINDPNMKPAEFEKRLDKSGIKAMLHEEIEGWRLLEVLVSLEKFNLLSILDDFLTKQNMYPIKLDKKKMNQDDPMQLLAQSATLNFETIQRVIPVLKKFGYSCETPAERPPICLAAYHQNYSATRAFIMSGANVNALSTQGWSSLHYVVAHPVTDNHGNPLVSPSLKALAEADKVDLHLRDPDFHETPAMFAVDYRNRHAVEFLISKFKDPIEMNLVNRYGFRCFELAHIDQIDKSQRHDTLYAKANLKKAKVRATKANIEKEEANFNKSFIKFLENKAPKTVAKTRDYDSKENKKS